MSAQSSVTVWPRDKSQTSLDSLLGKLKAMGDHSRARRLRSNCSSPIGRAVNWALSMEMTARSRNCLAISNSPALCSARHSSPITCRWSSASERAIWESRAIGSYLHSSWIDSATQDAFMAPRKRVLHADKESTPGEMKGDMIATIFRMTNSKSKREKVVNELNDEVAEE